MLEREFVRKKKGSMSRGDMLTRGDVQRNPLSLMSKGEKIEELFPSMPKAENVEYGFH